MSLNQRADQAVDAWATECTDGRVSAHTMLMIRQFAYHALPPIASEGKGAASERGEVERAHDAAWRAIYGGTADPHQNPEVYDFCCNVGDAVLATLRSPASVAPTRGDAVDDLAAKMAAADGLDWDEVCGSEADDGGVCDSSTCVAALWEEHDPDVAREHYRRYARLATPPAPSEGVGDAIEAVAKYAQHLTACRLKMRMGALCDCGLNVALAKLKGEGA